VVGQMNRNGFDQAYDPRSGLLVVVVKIFRAFTSSITNVHNEKRSRENVVGSIEK
jgi:hypothetical protein